MIGNGYWATGITVKYGYAAGAQSAWGAHVNYLDAGFCNDVPDDGLISTEGTLATRYMVKEGDGADVLTAVIDAIKADADRLGIAWRNPRVYYQGDGEHDDYPPPEGWRETVDAQAVRLGWAPMYVHDAEV